MSKAYVDAAQTIKQTATETQPTKQLWRQENKPVLIKAGLALIALPDPTVTDVVGSAMVAAGLVQEGIRRRTLYVEDVEKILVKSMKELRNTREQI